MQLAEPAGKPRGRLRGAGIGRMFNGLGLALKGSQMRAWWWRRCFVAAVATAFGICPAAQADDATQRGERAASEQAAEEVRAAQAAKAAFHPSHLRSSVATMGATRAHPAATSHVWQAGKAARPPPAIIPRIAFSEATGESSETYFDEHIDGIIQGQCIACHVLEAGRARLQLHTAAVGDALHLVQQFGATLDQAEEVGQGLPVAAAIRSV